MSHLNNTLLESNFHIWVLLLNNFCSQISRTIGIPPPVLHWYRDNVMIDGSYIINNSIANNDLIVYKLSRNDLNVMFICQANNFNNTHPIQASVSIDINCEILSLTKALIAFDH
jgi:hypothetical protein